MPTYSNTHREPNLIPKNELVFDNFEDMAKVLEATTRNGWGTESESHYCVMVSREEGLYVLNFLYSDHCDRNNVVFMDREAYEEEVFSNTLREEDENDL